MAVPMANMMNLQQNQNTENAFVEYLANHINTMDPNALGPGGDEVLNAFNNTFEVYIDIANFGDFQVALRGIRSPKHRAMVLRTVFHTMLRGAAAAGYPPNTGLGLPFSEDQRKTLAGKFNVAPTPAELDRIAAQPASNLPSTLINSAEIGKLRKSVQTGIFSNNLDSALGQFEIDNYPKQTQGSQVGMFGMIQAMLGGNFFSRIANPLGIGGPNNIFAFFGQLLSGFLGPLFSMFAGFSEMAKKVQQANKIAEGAPLDDEDIQQNPAIAKEAAEFAELSQSLAQLGGKQGELIATELNKEWRITPNHLDVWKKLINGLEKHAFEHADEWLRAKERELLTDLTAVVEALEAEELAGVGHAITVQTQALHTNLDNYRLALEGRVADPARHVQAVTGLEAEILSYAPKKYKVENFDLRYKLYQEVYKDLNEIKVKYHEASNAHQDSVRLDQQRQTADAQRVAAAAANPPLAQSLQNRIATLQLEINALNNKNQQARNEMVVARNDLQNNVIGRVLNLYNHHGAQLNAGVREARRVEREERRARARGPVV